MMSFHYPWKCTNKEKLIPLHVTNCECGVVVDAHVSLEANVSGSISGDTHYYTLRPPFCKKHIKKKTKNKKNKKNKKQKQKSFELRDDLIPLEGT